MSTKDLLDVLQFLVGIGTIISLIVAVVSLLMARKTFQRQMNAQVYLAYTDRFEKLVADCPDEFRSAMLSMKLSDTADKERSRVKACMIRYLNLCSEEFYLLKSGYLAREVWQTWQRELERTLRTRLYRSGWEDLQAEYESYPEFVAYVERVQSAK